MIIRLAALCLAFTLFLSLPAFAAGEKPVFVGGQDLSLPQLPAFKEIYGTNEQFDALVRQFVPAENRLLAVYVTEADATAMHEGREPKLAQYIMVQTPKNDMTFKGERDFDVVRAEVAKGANATDLGPESEMVQKKLDEASGYMNDNMHRRTKLRIGETRGLGAFMNYEGAFGVAMIANVGVQAEDGTQDLPIVTSITALNLKGKPVFLNVYSHYQGNSDADFVRNTARDYTKLVFTANGLGELKEAATPPPSVEEARAPTVEEEADNRLNIALGIAFVACIGVLVFFLIPLFRKLGRGRDESV